MSNSKANIYSAVILTNDLQVKGVDKLGKLTPLSNINFALNLGISEDGTLWALSVEPDQDGGGSKIFWSNGDSNWTEINTPDPGGIQISGGAGSTCYFLTNTDEVWSMDTSGQAQKIFGHRSVFSMDTGGGMIWAVMIDPKHHFPALYYSAWDNIDWKKFELRSDQVAPFAISTNYQGDCYGIVNNDPIYFSKDGKTQSSAGRIKSDISLEITFKNWNYILSTDVNKSGNLVYEWQDDRGGTYMPTNIRCYKVLSTYYRVDG